MKDYQKILARLKASKGPYDAVRRAEAAGGFDRRTYEDAIQEYMQAWDAAGVIWDAACEAEATARKLWALLAPFDDEAATRLRELL